MDPLEEDIFTVIGVYAPVTGEEEGSEEFCEYLHKAVQAVNPEEKLVKAGDLHA